VAILNPENAVNVPNEQNVMAADITTLVTALEDNNQATFLTNLQSAGLTDASSISTSSVSASSVPVETVTASAASDEDQRSVKQKMFDSLPWGRGLVELNDGDGGAARLHHLLFWHVPAHLVAGPGD
jgi:hypothetical protein